MIGWQDPVIYSLPEKIAGSYGQACIDLAAVAGLHLDPWQEWLVKQTLSYTNERVVHPQTGRLILRNGKPMYRWAAFEVGLMVSRQNGKGSYLEAIELASLFLLGEKMIIHSAHEFKTSMNHLDRMWDLISGCRKFDKYQPKVRKSNGSEGISITFPKTDHSPASERDIRFFTRTGGGGRGFSPQRVIMDEAMFITPEHIGALMPAMSAQPNPQIICAGSAGDKNSTHFGKIRSRALNTDNPDPRLFYAEWSIDPHSDRCEPDCEEHDAPDSVESYAKANPGMGYRPGLTVEYIDAERRSMSADMFLQEVLGVGDWPEESEQWTVIGKSEWMGRQFEASQISDKDPWVLAAETSPDGKWSCITAVGKNLFGQTHVEITGRGSKWDYRPGSSWVLPRLLEICHEHNPTAVVINTRGPAGGMAQLLDLYGIRVISPTSAEYAQACSGIFQDIVPPRGVAANLVHINQPPLNTAVAATVKREVMNYWMWDKRLTKADITPLDSATLGWWGYTQVRSEKKTSVPWVVRM